MMLKAEYARSRFRVFPPSSSSTCTMRRATALAKVRSAKWGSCDSTGNRFTLTHEYVPGQNGEQVTESDGMLFVSLCLLLVGALAAVQPERMLRWTIREHLELARTKSATVTTRFIGIGLVGLGLTILALL